MGTPSLHVEYAGGGIQYGILFIFSLFYEYGNPKYDHIHGICRVSQAEYAIRILVAAPQEYVNTFATCRTSSHVGLCSVSHRRRCRQGYRV